MDLRISFDRLRLILYTRRPEQPNRRRNGLLRFRRLLMACVHLLEIAVICARWTDISAELARLYGASPHSPHHLMIQEAPFQRGETPARVGPEAERAWTALGRDPRLDPMSPQMLHPGSRPTHSSSTAVGRTRARGLCIPARDPE